MVIKTKIKPTHVGIQLNNSADHMKIVNSIGWQRKTNGTRKLSETEYYHQSLNSFADPKVSESFDVHLE